MMKFMTVEGRVAGEVLEEMQHDAAKELSELLDRWAKRYHKGFKPHERSVEVRQ